MHSRVWSQALCACEAAGLAVAAVRAALACLASAVTSLRAYRPISTGRSQRGCHRKDTHGSVTVPAPPLLQPVLERGWPGQWKACRPAPPTPAAHVRLHGRNPTHAPRVLVVCSRGCTYVLTRLFAVVWGCCCPGSVAWPFARVIELDLSVHPAPPFSPAAVHRSS